MSHGLYIPPESDPEAFPPDISLPGNCSPSDIILCSSPEPEDIDDAEGSLALERRSAKRRRIEQHARRYLRGDTLYIHSARLRGPFTDNPWSRAKLKERPENVQAKAPTSVGAAAAGKKKADAGKKAQQTNLKGKLKSSKPKITVGSQETEKTKDEGLDFFFDEGDRLPIPVATAKPAKSYARAPLDTFVADSPKIPRRLPPTESIPSTSQQMREEMEESKKEMREFFSSKTVDERRPSLEDTPTTKLRNTLSRVPTTRGGHHEPPSPSPHANARKFKAPSRARSELAMNNARSGPALFQLPDRTGTLQKSKSATGLLGNKSAVWPSETAEAQFIRDRLGSQVAVMTLSPFDYKPTNGAAPRNTRPQKLISEAENAADNGASSSEDIIPFKAKEAPKRRRSNSGIATFSPGTAYRGKKEAQGKAGPRKRLLPIEPTEEESEEDDCIEPPPPKKSRKTSAKAGDAQEKAGPAVPVKKVAAKPKEKPSKKQNEKPKALPKAKPRAKAKAKINKAAEQEKPDAPVPVPQLQEVNPALNKNIIVNDPIEATPQTSKDQALSKPDRTEQVVDKSESKDGQLNQPANHRESIVEAVRPQEGHTSPKRTPAVLDKPGPGNMSPVSPLDELMVYDHPEAFPGTAPSPLEVRKIIKAPSPSRKIVETTSLPGKSNTTMAPTSRADEPPPSSKLTSPPASDELDREESTVEMSSGRFRDALMHSAQKIQSGTEDILPIEDIATPHIPLNTQAEFLAAANSFNRCLANSPVKFTADTPAPIQMAANHCTSFTAINSPDRPALVDEEQTRRKLFRTSPLKHGHFTPFKSIDQVTPSKKRLSLVGGSQANASYSAGSYSPLTYSPFVTGQNSGPMSAEGVVGDVTNLPGSQSIAMGLGRIESSSWLDDVLGQNEEFLERDSFNLDQEAKAEAVTKTPMTTRKGKIITSRSRIST